MQELGKGGVAKLFFQEYCRKHPSVLKPAVDNINLIKRYTIGHSRWTRMTEHRKLLTRDKFYDIYRCIKFIQDKCGDQNDLYRIEKRIERQSTFERQSSLKQAISDEVQSFHASSIEGSESEASEKSSTTPSKKKKKKGFARRESGSVMPIVDA